jgi:ERCC4-type nuclease
MRVVVDDRERASVVACHLCELGAEVEVARLPLGDFLVDGRLLVERKTVADLAASVCDGRLFRQAKRLASHADQRVCIILEGTSRDAGAAGVSREALQGAMVSLTLVFGLPVLRARDEHETARLVVYAAGQLARTALGISRRVAHRTRRGDRARLEMLQAIPGIGPRRALALLTRFGNVARLAASTPDSVAAVPGVGPTLASRVAWVIGLGFEALRGVDESTRPDAGSTGATGV